MAGAYHDLIDWRAEFERQITEWKRMAVEDLKAIDVASDILASLRARDFGRAENLADTITSILSHPLLGAAVAKHIRQIPYAVDSDDYLKIETWAPTVWKEREGDLCYIRACNITRNPDMQTLAIVDGPWLIMSDRHCEEWKHGVYRGPNRTGWLDVDWEGKLEESKWSDRRRRKRPSRTHESVPGSVVVAHDAKTIALRHPEQARTLVDKNMYYMRKDALFVSRKLTRSRATTGAWSQLMEAIQHTWRLYAEYLGTEFPPLLPPDRQDKTAYKQVRHKLESK